jgi:hypothetical protein
VEPHPFFFALAVSGGLSRDLLTELAARVLERAGSAGDGAAALGEALHAAIARAGAAADLVDIRFRAGDGRLHIVVSSHAGEIWQTSRDIP